MQAVITGMCILLLVLRLAPGFGALLRCNLSQVCLNLSQVMSSCTIYSRGTGRSTRSQWQERDSDSGWDLPQPEALPVIHTRNAYYTRSLYFNNERVTTLIGRRKLFGLLHPAITSRVTAGIRKRDYYLVSTGSSLRFRLGPSGGADCCRSVLVHSPTLTTRTLAPGLGAYALYSES